MAASGPQLFKERAQDAAKWLRVNRSCSIDINLARA